MVVRKIENNEQGYVEIEVPRQDYCMWSSDTQKCLLVEGQIKAEGEVLCTTSQNE